MRTILLSLLLVGCAKQETPSPDVVTTIISVDGKTNRVKLPDGSLTSLVKDFVMGEPNAVSNAIYHCKQPPEGWSIVCDGKGHYAPKHAIALECDVRTNEYEAVVAAWRDKAIWDAPHEPVTPAVLGEPKYQWHQCDEDLVVTNRQMMAGDTCGLDTNVYRLDGCDPWCGKNTSILVRCAITNSDVETNDPSAVYSNVLTNEPLNTNIGPLTNLAWSATNFYAITTNNGWLTNSKPFGEFRNITTPTNYGNGYYGIDWDHPTNIEAIFYHEPVIIGHSNGMWVVHFKEGK